MAFREGDVVGTYTVIKPLGAGGMATVYLAEHTMLGRRVAIKVMHDSFANNEEFLKRFEREAKIVANLDHPNIVPIHDYSIIENVPYLVMKYIEGKSLKRVLNEKQTLTVEEIITLLTPIAAALTYAHARGFLHRDVKPSNIIVDTENVPFLADFGLARIALAGESTLSRDVILGTPAYISPEQAAGLKTIDGRADTYSLAIVLYQLLVGSVPFNADTPIAILHEHLYSDVPPPSKINPSIPVLVEKVLLKALAKEPQDRYETPSTMIQAFADAAAQARFSTVDAAFQQTASESIASYKDQVHAAHAAAVSAPIARDANTILEGSSIREEYQFRRTWLWALAGFLIFACSSIGWLGTIDSISERSDARYEELVVTAAVAERQAYIQSLPDVDTRDAVAFLNRRPDEIELYLSGAITAWNADRMELGDELVDAGLAITSSPVDYLLVASDLAHEADRPTRTVVFGLLALAKADNRTLSIEVENQVMPRAYAIATSGEGLEADAGEALVSTLLELRPPLGSVIIARLAITMGRVDDTEAFIDQMEADRLDEDSPYVQLVAGDYTHDTLDDTPQAIEHWQDAAAHPDAPLWVVTQANERLQNQ